MSDQDNVTQLQTVDNREFTVGDVVVLKCGSPSMVLSKYSGDQAICTIMTHNGPENHPFDPKLLETMDNHATRMLAIHDRGCAHNPQSSNYIRPPLWERILNVFRA